MGKRTGNPVGRPKVDLSKEMLMELYKEMKTWDKVANYLAISQMTIYRRLKEYGIKKYYNY